MLMYNDFNTGISLGHREIEAYGNHQIARKIKFDKICHSLAKYVHSFEINWFRL